MQDALAGEEFGYYTNGEAEHGHATVQSLSFVGPTVPRFIVGRRHEK